MTEDREVMSGRLKPISDAEIGYSLPENAYDTPIHWLPSEILEYIFTFLDIKQRIRLEQVCKKWRWVNTSLSWTFPRNLAFDGNVYVEPWSTYDKLATYPVTQIIVSSILSRCGSGLKQVTLAANDLIDWDSLLEMVAEHCLNLVQITLVDVALDNPSVGLIGKYFKSLKEVTLYQCREINEEGLRTLLKGCKGLASLKLFPVANSISGDSFGAVNPNLKALGLWFSQRPGDPLRFDRLTSRCDYLQELDLLLRDGLERMDRQSLLDCLIHYKGTLKTFGMRCTSMCDVVLVLTNLENLTLSNCSQVNSHFCRQLVKKCVKIRSLDLSCTMITDEQVTYLTCLPKLIILNINSTCIRGPGIEELAKQGRLQKLYACGLRLVPLGDNYFRYLSTCCPNIQVLAVHLVPTITNELVRAFCLAMEKGYLSKPLEIHANGTSITPDVETCKLLRINFCLWERLYNPEDWH